MEKIDSKPMRRKLPIGIQAFEDLRTNGYIYVDKTKFIEELLIGKVYFLSRPRRFGKSLFLSTLKSYFEGKKELFDGLYISKVEKDWLQYPVFYFDFNGKSYSEKDALKKVLNEHLERFERVYGKNTSSNDVDIRFGAVIRSAFEKTGRKVVVLVDEYDKSLLENDGEQKEANRALFKGFFGNLKACDEYLKFVFITGVTKFSKVSIFSDLNQLQDISMDKRYSEICGITFDEMLSTFETEIEDLANENSLSKDECLKRLEKMYDGYHFSKGSNGIYNPFSVLNTFASGEFNNYWFETGTPSFLSKMMLDSNFDYKLLEEGIDVDSRSLEEYRLDSSEPVPLLYQTGYLTIKRYEQEFNSYTIALPNEEVKFSLYKRLLPLYAGFQNDDKKIEIVNFLKELRAGKVDDFMKRINNIFESAPKQTNQKQYELNCQAFVWLIFKLIGEFVLCEVQNGDGRSDAVVWEKNAIYIFEFKMDGSSDAALDQINDKNYPIAYKSDGRKIVKIGANYSSKEKKLTDWKIS